MTSEQDSTRTTQDVGRPKKQLSSEIVELLRTTDHRAMTIGMITDEVDGARRTVHDRLENLVEDGPIESDKIGNATAYYHPGTNQKGRSDSGKTKTKSGRELEPEVGHKGPPIARKLFGLIGMGNNDK